MSREYLIFPRHPRMVQAVPRPFDKDRTAFPLTEVAKDADG